MHPSSFLIIIAMLIYPCEEHRNTQHYSKRLTDNTSTRFKLF